MSSMVYDEGSVFDFRPGQFRAFYTPDECEELEYRGVGWATRVVSRDGWAVQTEVVAMVDLGGNIVPLDGVTNAPGSF